LRVQLLHQLKTQEEEARRRKSEAIRRKLWRLAVFRSARTILCYVSLPHEVQTWQLIHEMLETGKRVVVPKVHGKTLQLSVVRNPHRELARGRFGVWEPRRLRHVRPEELDLALVPGLAFDRTRHRLGHGHGYFDRLLARLPKSIPTIGLCFAFQRVNHLPARPHDQTVHTVLSH